MVEVVGGIEAVEVDEHRRMIEHIMSGEADKAEEDAREHTVHFRQRVLNYVMSSAAAGIKIGE